MRTPIVDQFYAIASNVMRQVLVSHARGRATAKRGGGLQRVTLGDPVTPLGPKQIDLLALDEALNELARRNPERAKLIELRFFGGLQIEEAADACGISRTEAVRRWRLAKAWLAGRLSEQAPS